MTRLRWLDRLLLLTLLPAFVVALTLHVREGRRTGLQQLPLFATSEPGSDYPIVGGLRHEFGGRLGELRVGDRLLRVGERDLRGLGTTGFEAHALAEAGLEPEVPVLVERDGERLALRLELERLAQPYHRVPFLVGMVLVAVAVLLRSGGTRDARLFFASLATFALFETPFRGGPPLQTYASSIVFLALGPVAIALLLVALTRLPAEVPEAQRASKRWAWLALLFPIVRVPYFFGAPFPTAWFSSLPLLADALFLTTGFYIMGRNALHAGPVGRRRVKWVLWGGLIGVLPITLVIALQPFFPAPAVYSRFFQYAAICAVFFPLGLMMAIFRENLFDIDRLLSSTATFAVVVGAAATLGLTVAARVAPGIVRLTGLGPEAATLLAVAVLAGAAVPLAARVRPRVEAWLLPERAALERGLQRLLRDLSDCESAEELLGLVEARIALLLRPAHAVLLVERQGRFEAPGELASGLLASGALAQALESEPSPRDGRALRRLLGSLPESERGLFERWPTELLLSFRNGRRLAALLLLGPKRSREPYLAMETALLGAVAEKASGELARLRTLAVAESERVRADEARGLMEKAEEANRAKSRFLAAASHDLRQPLHALGLFVERLRGRSTGDELVGQIQRSVEALSTQFDALLDLSRLDAGGVVPRVSGFALGPELARLAAEHAEAARAKGLALRFDPADAWVASDPVLLLRILHNLLSNAIRHTPSGEVHLRTRPRGGALAIEVADTGPGIPADQQRAIFGEFVQLEGASRGEGLGLGLSIVERTAALLGHALELESTLGHGSVFRVIVPRTAASERPAAEAELAPTRLVGRSVLLVEDEASVRDAMVGLLESWGCTVLAARSASEARALLSRAAAPPALVIADYGLDGDETGLDVVLAARELAGPDLPAVIVSGESTQPSRDAIRSSGLPFLAKPVPPARLRALLGKLLDPGR